MVIEIFLQSVDHYRLKLGIRLLSEFYLSVGLALDSLNNESMDPRPILGAKEMVDRRIVFVCDESCAL